ncbi:MAG: hypothetical protein ACKPKO_15590, partial [Candidatus Fonsibacter sp.]
MENNLARERLKGSLRTNITLPRKGNERVSESLLAKLVNPRLPHYLVGHVIPLLAPENAHKKRIAPMTITHRIKWTRLRK